MHPAILPAAAVATAIGAFLLWPRKAHAAVVTTAPALKPTSHPAASPYPFGKGTAYTPSDPNEGVTYSSPLGPGNWHPASFSAPQQDAVPQPQDSPQPLPNGGSDNGLAASAAAQASSDSGGGGISDWLSGLFGGGGGSGAGDSGQIVDTTPIADQSQQDMATTDTQTMGIMVPRNFSAHNLVPQLRQQTGAGVFYPFTAFLGTRDGYGRLPTPARKRETRMQRAVAPRAFWAAPSY